MLKNRISGNYEVSEKDDKIFLNGVYQGEAFAKDTVILRPRGILTIKTKNGSVF